MLRKNEAIQQVERLLQTIKAEKKALEDISSQYQKEVEAVQAKYYKHIEEIKKNIKTYELELEKTAKKYKYALFDGTDVVDTQFGRLICTIKFAVKRAKGVLEKLEELGWNEAIIIEKKVNWDKLERWPDERLIACGTERVKKEKIEYELNQ
jgi:archaellum component FlaC